jgi:hypothetical protein
MEGRAKGGETPHTASTFVAHRRPTPRADQDLSFSPPVVSHPCIHLGRHAMDTHLRRCRLFSRSRSYSSMLRDHDISPAIPKLKLFTRFSPGKTSVAWPISEQRDLFRVPVEFCDNFFSRCQTE